jgi:hypothetical protein
LARVDDLVLGRPGQLRSLARAVVIAWPWTVLYALTLAAALFVPGA